MKAAVEKILNLLERALVSQALRRSNDTLGLLKEASQLISDLQSDTQDKIDMEKELLRQPGVVSAYP